MSTKSALLLLSFSAVLLLIVAVDSYHKLDHGTVVDKSYTGDYWMPVTTYTMIGNNSYPMTTLQYYPESFGLIVQGQYKKHVIRERWDVPKEKYNSVKVGDEVKR